jgi:RNA polymerase sigma-70 factor (ECF subfamily)
MEGRTSEDVRNRTDEELVREFQDSRDGELFGVLVRRHQDRVFAMCSRFLGSPSQAEEVAQDVFIAVYRNLDRFRGDAKFSTWLHRVVINHCKNRQAYRARRRELQHESIDQSVDTGEGEIKRELPSPTPGPEKATEAKQRREILEQGLARLGEDHRAVIVMYDLQGMPYDEIAATLGVAEGTVKSRLHRARSELKNLVGRMLLTVREAEST